MLPLLAFLCSVATVAYGAECHGKVGVLVKPVFSWFIISVNC